MAPSPPTASSNISETSFSHWGGVVVVVAAAAAGQIGVVKPGDFLFRSDGTGQRGTIQKRTGHPVWDLWKQRHTPWTRTEETSSTTTTTLAREESKASSIIRRLGCVEEEADDIIAGPTDQARPSHYDGTTRR